MASELFSFEKNLPEFTRLAAFESSGSISLITNPKGEFFSKEQYSTNYNQINPDLYGQNLTLIGAEKSGGKNYLAFTSGDDKRVQIWEATGKWKPKKFISSILLVLVIIRNLFKQDFDVRENAVDT